MECDLKGVAGLAGTPLELLGQRAVGFFQKWILRGLNFASRCFIRGAQVRKWSVRALLAAIVRQCQSPARRRSPPASVTGGFFREIDM